MEVDITDSQELGFNGLIRLFRGDDTDFVVASLTDPRTIETVGTAITAATLPPAAPLVSRYLRDTRGEDDQGNKIGPGTVTEAILRAAASDGGTNVISAPHILTSDNEQAEIRIGDNIPIISSRVESAAGIQTETGLSTSVNVERQDIGVTLRVTPQITEGETLRLEIFQEITTVNEALSEVTGSAEDVGVALSSRRVENTVVVGDGETVVIGGLISDVYQDTVNKVPFLGDIPFLGWAFKSTTTSLVKKNLLVFLTPHIVRQVADLERETIRKREEFREKSSEVLELSEQERKEIEDGRREAELAGIPYEPPASRNPVRMVVLDHEARYPLQRMREIEQQQREESERQEAERRAAIRGPRYFVRGAVYGDEDSATETLTKLLDAGFDGELVSGEAGGTVLHEIHLGPFESLEEAQRVGQVLRSAHGLAPAVVVEPPADE
jgi:hypothetical protein